MNSISERRDGEGNDERTSKMGKGAWLFGGVVSCISLVIAIGGLWITWTSLKNQGDYFAWRVISSQKPGNSGVGWALERLNERGEALNHVVLEPRAFFSVAHAADTTQDSPAPEALYTYAAERVLDGIVLRYGWLDHTNFSYSSLKEADLREATLKRADLTGTNLEQARLADADLNKANLTGASLVRVQADKVRLERATALQTHFEEAKLAEGNLIEMIGIGAFFDEAEMTGVRLNNAKLTGASLKGVDLTDAIINDTDLGYADLTAANLQRASIGDANFKGANISGIKLSEASGVQDAEWEGAWVWEDLKDTMSKMRWPKKGQEEEEKAWKEILSTMVVYYPTKCKEDWEARVAREIQQVTKEDQPRAVVIAAGLYRPPENCVPIAPKTVLNEESGTDRVVYRTSSREGRR